MLRFIIFSVVFFSFILPINSQEVSVEWSDDLIEFKKRKKDQYVNKVIGSNDQYVYVLLESTRRKSRFASNAPEKFTVQQYDKSNLKLVKEVPLKGYGNVKESKEYLDLDVLAGVMADQTVRIFWRNKNGNEILLEELREDLTIKTNIQLICNIGGGSLVHFLESEGDSDNVAFVVQSTDEINKPLYLNYVLLDSDFNEINKGRIDFPFKPVKKNRLDHLLKSKLDIDYKLAPKGQLIIKTYGRREKKRLYFDTEYPEEYTLFIKADLLTEEVALLPLLFDDKIVKGVDFKMNNEVEVFGFYSDIDRFEDEPIEHGVYTALINLEDFDLNNEISNPFAENYLKKINENISKSERRSKNRTLVVSGKGAFYQVEKILKEDDGSVLLFSSFSLNTADQSVPVHGTSSLSQRIDRSCKKKNVLAIKLNSQREIVWLNNALRHAEYSTNYQVKDLKVIKEIDNYYVAYPSHFEVDEKGFLGTSKRLNRDEIQNNIEYAMFNTRTSEYSVNRYNINPSGTSKKFLRKVRKIYSVDNNLYFYARNFKKKKYLSIGLFKVKN